MPDQLVTTCRCGLKERIKERLKFGKAAPGHDAEPDDQRQREAARHGRTGGVKGKGTACRAS
ncbi:MAG: hypothetical protein H6672_22390 [Anaerolineaceae bacterium]|nr:hypothetical protein [Anaerolineaceae bacterium]